MCFPLSCLYAEHPWPRTNGILQLANPEEHSGQSALAPSAPIYDTGHAQRSGIPVFLQASPFLFQTDVLSGGNWKTWYLSLVLLTPGCVCECPQSPSTRTAARTPAVQRGGSGGRARPSSARGPPQRPHGANTRLRGGTCGQNSNTSRERETDQTRVQARDLDSRLRKTHRLQYFNLKG